MAKYDPNEAINPARNMKRREEEAGEKPSRITEVDAATTRTTGTMTQADFSGYGDGTKKISGYKLERREELQPKPKRAPSSPKRIYSD
jgi:hypothetical protein